MSGASAERRIPPALVGAAAFALVAAAVGIAILHATDGVFSFTLDDPYIHLAMAEEIARGGYGVNPGEAASASSSALYPFLLAGPVRLGVGEAGALAVNLAAGAISTALLLRLAQEGGLLARATPAWITGALALMLVLALNLAGLAYTGMEHGLHVALTLAALLGVVRLGRREAAPPWLVPVLAVAPLVRFEGAAVLAAGVAALAWRRRWRDAALALGCGAAGLGGFALFLHAHGLPWLPSSVLAKAGDGAHGPGAQFLENQQVREGVLVILAVALPLAAEGLGRGVRPLRLPVLFASACLAAQMAVGTFGWRYNGWLHRYEAWAMALAAGVVLLAFGSRLRAWLEDAPELKTVFGFATAAALMQPYILTTAEAPFDARSIRLQQWEMHRFAADVLRAPVAVNDLGAVSFRNDHAVLDLWGLASEPARIARQAHRPPQWMDDLAHARGARAAMVYDRWVGPVPARWTRLGELRARVPLSVGPRVAFYAVEPADAPAVRAAVARWAKGLPQQDVFVAEPPRP